jgi:hypothetical protein
VYHSDLGGCNFRKNFSAFSSSQTTFINLIKFATTVFLAVALYCQTFNKIVPFDLLKEGFI